MAENSGAERRTPNNESLRTEVERLQVARDSLKLQRDIVDTYLERSEAKFQALLRSIRSTNPRGVGTLLLVVALCTSCAYIDPVPCEVLNPRYVRLCP